MLASGTGAWRVRDSMDRVARILGLTVHVDLSLLSIECTCIQGHESFSEVVSLPTTGVNTHRIWLMEDYVREVEAHGSQLTVRDFHKLLDVVEHSTPDYTLWQLGLAAGSACGAFVFLLGGGPVEMLCAFVGAGLGNLVRASMLRRRLGQFSCIACGVAVGLYFILRPYFGVETLSWMCILGAAPFAMLGFITYHGMTAEQFIWAWLRSEMLEPKEFKFEDSNYYYAALKDTIEELQTGRPGKKRRKEPKYFSKRKEAKHD